ncbi:hypothetical protein BpHYR1_014258 [Brachionus plicatilis]|uniref:Uncharacterized protein n=1 Tax=Brachionus plicatilis TaxID=10195 RepID=A0A3M7SVY9_BRAPC|nr:hypothetical protein BpHYR1_014258 [Brachionus plicatilis]
MEQEYFGIGSKRVDLQVYLSAIFEQSVQLMQMNYFWKIFEHSNAYRTGFSTWSAILVISGSSFENLVLLAKVDSPVVCFRLDDIIRKLSVNLCKL